MRTSQFPELSLVAFSYHPPERPPTGRANDEERDHVAVPIDHHWRAPRHGSPVSLGDLAHVNGIILNLVVLRSADMTRAADFYKRLGLQFSQHRHGSGPEHFTAELPGGVFEIYPLSADGRSTFGTRIGFRVPSVDDALAALDDFADAVVTPARDSEWGRRAVVADPDVQCLSAVLLIQQFSKAALDTRWQSEFRKIVRDFDFNLEIAYQLGNEHESKAVLLSPFRRALKDDAPIHVIDTRAQADALILSGTRRITSARYLRGTGCSPDLLPVPDRRYREHEQRRANLPLCRGSRGLRHRQ
jgi:lactoylglutathione lyase